jgi:hypothetical protein
MRPVPTLMAIELSVRKCPLGFGAFPLSEVFDDLDEFVHAVALPLRELDELTRSLDNGTPLGRPSDRDPAPAPELEEALIAEQPEGAQDGVRVHAEDGGEVLRRWESLAGFRLPFGDRATDLRGNLLVEIRGVGFVHLDMKHRASDTSTITKGEDA